MQARFRKPGDKVLRRTMKGRSPALYMVPFGHQAEKDRLRQMITFSAELGSPVEKSGNALLFGQ